MVKVVVVLVEIPNMNLARFAVLQTSTAFVIALDVPLLTILPSDSVAVFAVTSKWMQTRCVIQVTITAIVLATSVWNFTFLTKPGTALDVVTVSLIKEKCAIPPVGLVVTATAKAVAMALSPSLINMVLALLAETQKLNPMRLVIQASTLSVSVIAQLALTHRSR